MTRMKKREGEKGEGCIAVNLACPSYSEPVIEPSIFSNPRQRRRDPASNLTYHPYPPSSARQREREKRKKKRKELGLRSVLSVRLVLRRPSISIHLSTLALSTLSQIALPRTGSKRRLFGSFCLFFCCLMVMDPCLSLLYRGHDDCEMQRAKI